MGQTFSELPHWEFVVHEHSPGLYRVTATRDGGYTAEATAVDPDEALVELRAWAARVEHDVSALKEYKAIVWINDLPGKRVAVRSTGPDAAMARLRAEYGHEATISTWNDEDASRPR